MDRHCKPVLKATAHPCRSCGIDRGCEAGRDGVEKHDFFRLYLTLYSPKSQTMFGFF